MAKLIIEVASGEMDSGCVDSILRECVLHGPVLTCRMEYVSESGEPFTRDLMEVFHPETMKPKGNC